MVYRIKERKERGESVDEKMRKRGGEKKWRGGENGGDE